MPFHNSLKSVIFAHADLFLLFVYFDFDSSVGFCMVKCMARVRIFFSVQNDNFSETG